jgi:hypothetical protein
MSKEKNLRRDRERLGHLFDVTYDVLTTAHLRSPEAATGQFLDSAAVRDVVEAAIRKAEREAWDALREKTRETP